MNYDNAQNLVARDPDQIRLKRGGGSSIETNVLHSTLLTSSSDVDLADYFSAEAVRKMPAIERTMYANKVRNYRMLEHLGES